MTGRFVSAVDDELYWRDAELVRRFKALKSDFQAAFALQSADAQRSLYDGSWSEEDYDRFMEGYSAACETLGQLLEDRFSEITRRL